MEMCYYELYERGVFPRDWRAERFVDELQCLGLSARYCYCNHCGRLQPSGMARGSDHARA